MTKFGIGQSVRRTEDATLITGQGGFTDDFLPANTAHAIFLRSPHGHARILSIDVDAARGAPGVLAVYTGDDVAELGTIKALVPLKNRDGSAFHNPGRPMLATDKVRHVGEPVAMIVAETILQARDAAESIVVDYDVLPAVTDVREAAKPGAPQLFDDAPGNCAIDWELGDAKAVETAFAAAARVVDLDIMINRIVVASIETRGVLAQFDAGSGRFTIRLGTQGVMGVRGVVAGHLGVAAESVRILTGDVGGSFGMKGMDFQENSLVPFAARRLGRPVKWASDRQEAFLSDTQGREQWLKAELAMDAQHRFTGIRVSTLANTGAWLSMFAPFIYTLAGFRLLTGAYKIPCAYVHSRGLYTNTVWIDAYRGAGRPECAYIVERLVDHAAREIGMAPDALRALNFVASTDMPHATPMLAAYDSGDFAATMQAGLEKADWRGYESRLAQSKARGKWRGRGLAYYMEVTAAAPLEMADIRFTTDGRVRMAIGTGPSGQGHATSFAQVLEDKLGVPHDRIDFVFGDSDALARGGGTGGAKSMMLGGTALVDASEKIVVKGRKLAAHFLEAGEGDIEFEAGVFRIAGTDRAIPILDLAARTQAAGTLPEGLPDRLDDTGESTSGKNTFPNGCHVCEVEVDPDTGHIDVVAYTVVDDFGIVINPLLLMGQAHGGIVQGIGQALMENGVFDTEGQFLAGSFQDYAMPRAEDVPPIDIGFNNVPCTTNVMGLKGAGEAGTVGALAASINAVVDALSPAGVKHIDMPATPLRVWRAIHAGR